MSSLDGGKVVIVYVADFSKVKSEVLHSQDMEELNQTSRMRIRPVEEIMQTNHIQYEVQILHGEPGPTIVEYANKEIFDLVVIGSRGLNSLQEMVLRSVSHKVVKRVQSPVLIIK